MSGVISWFMGPFVGLVPLFEHSGSSPCRENGLPFLKTLAYYCRHFQATAFPLQFF